MRRSTIFLLATLGSLALVTGATAASANLFGGASMQGNQVKLVADVSNASTADDFSGVNLTDIGLTFSGITQLSTKFDVTDDDCGAGSPRFQINVGGKNVFVYLGPSPTFTGCTPNTLVDSGNLIGNSDACRWDTSQIQAGTQCNTYAGTLALIGAMQVTGIQLVVDSSWNPGLTSNPAFADLEQTVLVCDIRLNAQTFFPCVRNGNGVGANKVTICHHTQGKKGTKHVTIRISERAWAAHQKHGDTLGACTSITAKKAHARAAHVKKFHKAKKR